MTIKSHRDLHVWQHAVVLVELIYEVTKCFPGHEAYGLTSQLRRAAISIASNIAEGHAKASSKEDLRHVSISMGSVAEVDTQVEIATRLGYLSQDDCNLVYKQVNEIGKMLRGVQSGMHRRAKG